jgi:hypothetical protein
MKNAICFTVVLLSLLLNAYSLKMGRVNQTLCDVNAKLIEDNAKLSEDRNETRRRVHEFSKLYDREHFENQRLRNMIDLLIGPQTSPIAIVGWDDNSWILEDGSHTPFDTQNFIGDDNS